MFMLNRLNCITMFIQILVPLKNFFKYLKICLKRTVGDLITTESKISKESHWHLPRNSLTPSTQHGCNNTFNQVRVTRRQTLGANFAQGLLELHIILFSFLWNYKCNSVKLQSQRHYTTGTNGMEDERIW